MKETILTELPPLFEKLDDMVRKVYDPTQIWLESMQFADYVNQMAVHMHDCPDKDCCEELTSQLVKMSTSFKQMGENALTVLDEMEEGKDGA